ncbi:hypothetical protein M2302_006191 [Micromonospora sp. A200]|uniref:hypothetical protein n=1 Tax=Micromonospora sp. A200 TaxID=2940568 RepID=UPI00247624FB|nr:hypothetical protein [Micromonospora sp. A200]MDH6465988.1 hypothetical protein [Micromonospora sp. A200]
MGTDVTLLVGTAEPDDAPPCLARFGREVAGVLGLKDLRTGDHRYVIGDGEDFRAWLEFHPEDEEPHLSHPFWVDLATEKGAEEEVGRRLFQELADTGRFRVVLFLDWDCDRSTHFSCQDW